MKLLTYKRGGEERIGAVLSDGNFLDLKASAENIPADPANFASMQALINSGPVGLDAARRAIELSPDHAVVSPTDVVLRAPLPRPPRMRDTLMFMGHMENGLAKLAKSKADLEADPVAALERLMATGRYSLHPVFRERVIYYNTDHLAVSGPEDEIIWPYLSNHADYELEWACVVGQARRGIPTEEARSAIFGYTIFNDWSARDIQHDFMEANLGPSQGKDFAGSNTLGPWIVTADEIPDPYNLRMEARINGELWSQGSTSSMHHTFESTIAQFSRFEDLAPGEVIGSGTVKNGCGFELDRMLSDGDVVELEVEGIGVLRNTVRFS